MAGLKAWAMVREVSGPQGFRVHFGGEKKKQEKIIQVAFLGGSCCFLRCFVLRAHRKRVCRKTDFITSTGAGGCRDTGWDFCIPRKMVF